MNIEFLDVGGLYRAAIVDGRVFMRHRGEPLLLGRDAGPGLHERTDTAITIADVTIVRQPNTRRSAWVEVLSPGDMDSAETALTIWARSVGLGALWIDRTAIAFVAAGLPAGVARVDCLLCETPWSDAREDFWQTVWQLGLFPTECGFCGAVLPQWRVETGRQRNRRRARKGRSRPGGRKRGSQT